MSDRNPQLSGLERIFGLILWSTWPESKPAIEALSDIVYSKAPLEEIDLEGATLALRAIAEVFYDIETFMGAPLFATYITGTPDGLLTIDGGDLQKEITLILERIRNYEH
jgi:hypothetical protein